MKHRTVPQMKMVMVERNEDVSLVDQMTHLPENFVLKLPPRPRKLLLKMRMRKRRMMIPMNLVLPPELVEHEEVPGTKL